MKTNSFTLETTLRVEDFAQSIYIDVLPDPDGIGLVSVKTYMHERSKSFYGTIDLTLAPEQTDLIALAIRKVVYDINNSDFSKEFVLNRIYKIFEEAGGRYIEISPDPENTDLVLITTLNDKESSDWFGDVDLRFSKEHALLFAEALEIQSNNQKTVAGMVSKS